MARITGIGETITALPRGFLDHLGSGTGPVKNWFFKLPKQTLSILDQAGVIPADLQPMAGRVMDVTGTGAKAINVLQGVEKFDELVGAIGSAGSKGLFHDITDLTAKTTDFVGSGLDGASFVVEGAVLHTVKSVGSSLLALGMVCLSLNQGKKIVDATAKINALNERKQGLNQREADEIDEIVAAISTKRVNHYLKVAQWVSFIGVGTIGVLTLIFGMVLSPWFALMFAASSLFFSLVSGLHEHIHVKAAFEDLNENQMREAKDFAPKELKEAFKAHEKKWTPQPA